MLSHAVSVANAPATNATANKCFMLDLLVSLSISREACSRQPAASPTYTLRLEAAVCDVVVLLRILRFARSVSRAFLAASCIAVRFGLFLGLIVCGFRVLLA